MIRTIPFSLQQYHAAPAVEWHSGDEQGYVRVEEVIAVWPEEFTGVTVAQIRLSDGSVPVVQAGELRIIRADRERLETIPLGEVIPMILLFGGMAIGYWACWFGDHLGG